MCPHPKELLLAKNLRKDAFANIRADRNLGRTNPPKGLDFVRAMHRSLLGLKERKKP
ncbi:MAG: hypothetical protein WCW13_02335 [archaeon]|jgi:hypothetical protein